MSQALYRKWRSQTFEEVVGQEHVTETLRNALRDGRVAHAYLFSGPRGTGKTSTARILAKALNCAATEGERPCNRCRSCVAINEGRMIDLIEIDAASNNSVDDVRELRDKVSFRPSEGEYKIYIIDEVHMLSTSAFNALLKTLEEPPPHARFVLATTEPHKIPATVLSRCQRFDFRRIPVPEIADHLRHIAEVEGFGAEDDALTAIARSSQGCMRDAVSLLDQMRSFGDDTVTQAQVQQVLGAVSIESVTAIVDAIATKDVGLGLRSIQELLEAGASLTEFCQQVVDHLRGILLLQMTDDRGLLSDLPADLVDTMQEQAARMQQVDTLFAIKRFSETIPELKGGYQPQLPMELALVEASQGAPVQMAPVQMDQGATGQAATAPVAAPASATVAAHRQAQPTQANAPQEAAPAQASGGSVQLDTEAAQRLRARWKEFTTTVRRDCGHKVQAALNTVRDIAVADQAVAFAFGTNTFTRDMVDKAETRQQVANALSPIIGRTVTLECQLGDRAKLVGAVSTGAAAAKDKGPDVLVEYAVETLGAKVVE